MAHQASYRVYRPRRFSEVRGQARTVDTLREAVRQGRLTHAYVFAGPRGTGKTSVARILAKAVNCENLSENGDPCLSCASCRDIESGQHLDVIEIDAASNRGIDEIRDIKERITHQTAMSRYKVYIIDEAHMLTTEAFNAFLKTLEEPPPHALFVLATTEAHKLPITVLSRCQRYEFRRHTVPIIVEQLRYVAEQEQVDADPEALELMAQIADGAMRDALSLFDQVVATAGAATVDAVTRVAGMAGPAQMRQLLQALRSDIASLVGVLSDLRQDGLDERLILRDLARTLRDLLLYRTAGPDLFPPYRRDHVAALNSAIPDNVPPSWWIESADQLAQSESRLRGGFPPDLSVELTLLKLQQSLLAPAARPAPAEEPVRPALVKSQPSAPPSEPPQEAGSGDAGEVHVGGGQGEAFARVLEIVRRERPTTFALFEKTHGTVGPDGGLIIAFDFPAHRQLMDQPHNREVVDKAIRAVFGEGMRYRFEDAQGSSKPLAAAPEGAPKAPPLVQSVREWFGDDVTMVGFDPE